MLSKEDFLDILSEGTIEDFDVLDEAGLPGGMARKKFAARRADQMARANQLKKTVASAGRTSNTVRAQGLKDAVHKAAVSNGRRKLAKRAAIGAGVAGAAAGAAYGAAKLAKKIKAKKNASEEEKQEAIEEGYAFKEALEELDIDFDAMMECSDIIDDAILEIL